MSHTEVRNIRVAPFYWADNRVIDIYAERIGAYGLLVYTLLTRFANSNTGKCFPSQARMAEILGVSIASVERGVRSLSKHRLITVQRERDKGGIFKSTVYTVLPLGGESEPDKKILNCWYCGISGDWMEKEHQLPKSRGGKGDKGNIVDSCASCNRRKNDRTVDEYRKLFPAGHKFHGEIHPSGSGVDSHPSSHPSQVKSNKTINNTKDNNTDFDVADAIEKIRLIHPRSDAPLADRRAIKSAVARITGTGETLRVACASLYKAAHAYRLQRQAEGRDQFTKTCAAWFNGGCYEKMKPAAVVSTPALPDGLEEMRRRRAAKRGK